MLAISAIYDPMIDLYGYSEGMANVTKSSSIDPRIYVLRNAFLYVPLVLFLSTQDIRKSAISVIAISTILIAPFSIILYLVEAYESDGFSIFLIGEMAQYGGANISYNSYVPYLTFPVLSAIYLATQNSGTIFRLAALLFSSVVIIFTFLSSSRQTLLFIGIVLLLFLFYLHLSICDLQMLLFLLALLLLPLLLQTFLSPLLGPP